jgi:hypothetical protein
MATKILTIEKPETHIDNYDQFADSAMKLLYGRFGLNESHVNMRVRNILSEQKLRDLTVFLIGSDWAKSVETVGNLKIVELEN